MRALPLVAAAGCLLAVSGCGGSSSASPPSTTQSAAAPSAGGFEAPMSIRTTPAPPIALRDQNGHLVTLRSLRGKSVAITFVYTHCPDVCPILLSALSATRHRLGLDARRFAVLAVSVDPKGDRPAYVRHYLRQRRLAGAVHYLLGTRKQLMPVWAAYNIASRGDPEHPEQIGHSSLIYLVDTRGRLRLLYPAQPLDGKALVHDARLLARGA
jgi:protein SCO1/2